MRTALDFSHALNPLNPLPLNDLRVVQDYMTRAGFHPACDIEETDAHFLVCFDLPGVSKEDVKIELEQNELSVSGERREWRQAASDTASEDATRPRSRYHFAERTLGKFHRVFTLPMAVDSSGVKARFVDGVLQITLPKAEAAKPRQIRIES